MNFVINVDTSRVVGTVDKLDVTFPAGKWIDYQDRTLRFTGAPLLYQEFRYDQDSGRSYMALVYEVKP